LFKLKHHHNAGKFLAAAEPFLMQAEIQHCVLLSAPLRMRDKPSKNDTGTYFATIEQSGETIAAAFCPPRKWLNLTCIPHGGIALLVEDMRLHQATPEFVVADAESAQQFAQAWSKANDIKFSQDYSLRIYQLERVTPPRATPGTLRLGEMQDQKLVGEWSEAFDIDVDYGDASAIRELMLSALNEKRLYLWDDGGPVSMLARNAPTLNSERVSVVYTPPKLRGKGYGAAANAALAQIILNSGKRYACLFADMNNAISNKMYVNIGYQPVCDVARYKFLAAATS
jgi:predicted GNAT family acetyltransferase